MSFPMPKKDDAKAPAAPPSGKVTDGAALKPFPKGMPPKREFGKDKQKTRKKSVRMFGNRKK